MKLQRVEIHKIRNKDPNYEFFLNACISANNLYNHGNYLIRQKFIETTKQKEEGKLKNAIWLRYSEIDKLLKKDKDYPDYYKLPIAACSQQILRLLDKNWVSFFKSIKDWKKNSSKYTGRPKLPKYREKQNPYMLIIPLPYFRIKDDKIILTKAFNNFEITDIRFNKYKNFKSLQQIRIVPKRDYLKVELVYNLEIKEKGLNNNYLSIDIGVDNLATVTTNQNLNPIIINGKPLKSINHYYNKQKAYLQSRMEKCYNKKTSKRLQNISEKRENKINDYLHKASKFIIEYCRKNKITNIVIGHSSFWKQKSNLGKKSNQNFVQIPFNKFFKLIQYKAEEQNINVIITEESYTSKASYFDNDKIPKYKKGIKVKNKFSGKRICRGLYKTKNGNIINADINGSLNIMKKVVSNQKKADIGLMNKPVKITLSNRRYNNYSKIA